MRERDPAGPSGLLRVMQERRSAVLFKDCDVSRESLELILEAGRWAPSYINSQPWEFIVVRAPRLRARVAEIMSRITISWQAFSRAPVTVIIAVDSRTDPRHHLQDAAAAAQNMSLMAHGLGLATLWVAVYGETDGRGTPEGDLRGLLRIPRALRLAAAMPIGAPAAQSEGIRRPLAEMVHEETYRNGRRHSPRR